MGQWDGEASNAGVKPLHRLAVMRFRLGEVVCCRRIEKAWIPGVAAVSLPGKRVSVAVGVQRDTTID